MRQIIFRGKDAENGEWVYGFLTEGRKYNAIKDGIESVPIIENLHSDTPAVEIIPNTLGQFTGVRDHNGRKIYEGDIVDLDYILLEPWEDKEGSLKHMRCVVIYDDLSFRFKKEKDLCYCLNDVTNIEVIGNIHENPELMEGGKR